MPYTVEEIQTHLSEGIRKFGNGFSQHLRKNAGLPIYEYMEVEHALAGTKKSLKNIGSLNDMGANGWEIMYVSPTDDPDIIRIIYKRRKID